MIFRNMRKDEIDKVIKFLERNHEEVDAPQWQSKFGETGKEILEWQKKQETPEILMQYLSGSKEGELFILENKDHEIVGTVAIQYSKNPDLLPKLRYVASYPIRVGYGQILMNCIEEYALSKGYRGLRVQPSPSPIAEGFYENRGFITFEEEEVEVPTKMVLTSAYKRLA